MTYVLIAVLLSFFTFVNILAPLSGSATVTPILAGIVGAKDAIAIATVFFFLTCIPRIYLFRRYFRWEVAKRLWPVSILGALLGSIVLVGMSETIVTVIILGFLLYFTASKLHSVTTNTAKEKKPSKFGVVSVGMISGALQGAGLAGADLRNGYLMSRGLTINEIHGTTAAIGGANFLFASLVRVQSGDLTFEMAWPVLALFPAIILATYIGRHVALKLSKTWQERMALLVMIVALVLLVRKLLIG